MRKGHRTCRLLRRVTPSGGTHFRISINGKPIPSRYLPVCSTSPRNNGHRVPLCNGTGTYSSPPIPAIVARWQQRFDTLVPPPPIVLHPYVIDSLVASLVSCSLVVLDSAVIHRSNKRCNPGARPLSTHSFNGYNSSSLYQFQPCHGSDDQQHKKYPRYASGFAI